MDGGIGGIEGLRLEGRSEGGIEGCIDEDMDGWRDGWIEEPKDGGT